MLKKVKTSLLEIAYFEKGETNDPTIILGHGFPDDAETWNEITEQLAADGFRTLAPFVRGFGETRFLDKDTMRSGESVACAQDIIDFADALGIEKFTYVGHDWGATSAYLLAVLYPERLKNMVVLSAGYGVGLPETAQKPISPEQMHAYWYQWYFNIEQGAEALVSRRDEFCRKLWEVWSPSWKFSESEFQQTARSWENPDFPQIVIHSYRTRWDNEVGDERYKSLKEKLLGEPLITVPTIVLHGAQDGATLPEASEDKEKHFTNSYERIVLDDAGHFISRERPDAVIEAVRKAASSH
jgi:pimeloyl-ACP methyl ester carboxylesterase